MGQAQAGTLVDIASGLGQIVQQQSTGLCSRDGVTNDEMSNLSG